MSKEQWQAEQQQLIEDGVSKMIDWDVKQPKQYIKAYQKRIAKMQAQIQSV